MAPHRKNPKEKGQVIEEATLPNEYSPARSQPLALGLWDLMVSFELPPRCRRRRVDLPRYQGKPTWFAKGEGGGRQIGDSPDVVNKVDIHAQQGRYQLKSATQQTRWGKTIQETAESIMYTYWGTFDSTDIKRRPKYLNKFYCHRKWNNKIRQIVKWAPLTGQRQRRGVAWSTILVDVDKHKQSVLVSSSTEAILLKLEFIEAARELFALKRLVCLLHAVYWCI
ncbi:hypothetical protein J6590_044490 [Homalodisca vitripennis]|nr:hypothetical protein J6590_044490 [Homalodisca vitripennis]